MLRADRCDRATLQKNRSSVAADWPPGLAVQSPTPRRSGSVNRFRLEAIWLSNIFRAAASLSACPLGTKIHIADCPALKRLAISRRTGEVTKSSTCCCVKGAARSRRSGTSMAVRYRITINGRSDTSHSRHNSINRSSRSFELLRHAHRSWQIVEFPAIATARCASVPRASVDHHG